MTPTIAVSGPQTLLAWSALTTPHHERSARWYVIGSVAVIALAAYGILSGAWTMTLLALLLGGTYFLTRQTPPVVRTIQIQDKGFLFDNLYTAWTDCKDFWLIHTPTYTELHIVRKKGLNKHVVIQTADIDPIVIRTVLSQFLTLRSDQKERLLDLCIRLCKL